MHFRQKKALRQYMPAVCVILAAYLCRMINLFEITSFPFYGGLHYIQSFILIAFFIAWGISVCRRVIQIQVRRYLAAVFYLMLFWNIVRTVKFNFVSDPYLVHWLWYFYYLPMIFIPMYGLYVSFSICQSEYYTIPRKFKLLYIPAYLLLFTVLTNDLHHAVFIFPADGPKYPSSGYSYGIGYFAVAAWMLLCTAVTMVTVFVKNRMTDRKQRILIPVGILFALLVYCILAANEAKFIDFWLGDLTGVFCLSLVAFFESLFRLGLIQSNSEYVELFRSCSINAVIKDGDYNTVAAADDYIPLPEDVLRSCEDEFVMLENNSHLSSAQITDGRVFWTEDVSELTETMDKLKEIEAFLAAKRGVAEKEMESRRQKHRAIERKSLYDGVMSQTEAEIRRYCDLVDRSERESDPEEMRRIVLRITVVCAYIKRKISLIFQAKDNGEITSEQFGTCICKDTLPCVCGGGAIGDYSCSFDGAVDIGTAMTFYKAFYTASMAALDTLEAVEVHLEENNGMPTLRMRLVCDEDISRLACPCTVAEYADGAWHLTVTPEGGDEK